MPDTTRPPVNPPPGPRSRKMLGIILPQFRQVLMFSRLMWGGLITVLFLVSPSHAYVPHPLHMIDLMLGKPGTIKTVVLEQRIVHHPIDSANASEILQGKVSFIWPGGYRIERIGETGTLIQVVSGGETMTVRDGFIEPKPAGTMEFYNDLLYYRTRESMVQRLSQLGIDMTLAGPGLWQNRPQWIVGAHYPDAVKSQIWIDKESFRPLGWRLNPSGLRGYALYEIHYVNWQHKHNFRYPRRINIYQDDVLTREIEITSVTVNAKLDRNLFDLTKLRNRYPLRPAQPPGAPPKGEVEQVLEDFQKMYNP